MARQHRSTSGDPARFTTTPDSGYTDPSPASPCRRPGCSIRRGDRYGRVAPARRAFPRAAPVRACRRPVATCQRAPPQLPSILRRDSPADRRTNAEVAVALQPRQHRSRVAIAQLAQRPGGVEADQLATVLQQAPQDADALRTTKLSWHARLRTSASRSSGSRWAFSISAATNLLRPRREGTIQVSTTVSAFFVTMAACQLFDEARHLFTPCGSVGASPSVTGQTAGRRPDELSTAAAARVTTPADAPLLLRVRDRRGPLDARRPPCSHHHHHREHQQRRTPRPRLSGVAFLRRGARSGRIHHWGLLKQRKGEGTTALPWKSTSP